jgi:predicted Holliday junction resolvase-like endonuclease
LIPILIYGRKWKVIFDISVVFALIISMGVNIWLFFRYIERDAEAKENRTRTKDLEETIVALKEFTDKYKGENLELQKNLESEQKLLVQTQEKYATLLNQKKSSEVRIGQIGEHIAPFLTDWPWDSKNFRFLGNPIDGIQFNEDGLIFVEIKTGKSQLSKNQRIIRDLIKDGKVCWAVFRIGEDECSVKYEENKDV